jgi:uncharacterized damage-inducible protein DinB
MAEETRAAEAAVRLQAVTDDIVSEVRRLPPELITWVPAEGVWSVMDILCHIREFIPFWTEETLRIARRPQEPWGRDHTDTARLAAVANTASHKLEDVLADIRRAVQRSAETLKGLGDADLAVEAASKNPRLGGKTGGVRPRSPAGAARREAPRPDSSQRRTVRRRATRVIGREDAGHFYLDRISVAYD